MSVIEKLHQKLSSMNVELTQLDSRAQRKYEELKRILRMNTKSVRDNDGKLKPNAKRKVKDLLSDILDFAYALKDEDAAAEAAAAKEKEEAEAAAEAAAAKEKEEAEAAAEAAAAKEKSGGVLDWLFN
jgi:hypothetical protein